MNGHLLLIDDKGAHNRLLTVLEKHRFFVFHARGPLKIESVLERHQIDLIVWKENSGHEELVGDLEKAWGKFQDIPVLHLFPPHGAHSSLPSKRFRESIPDETPEIQLIRLVSKMVAEARAARGTPPQGRNELAFRNVLTRLRRPWNSGKGGAMPPYPHDDFHTANTGLHPGERELLRTAQHPLEQGDGIFRKVGYFLGRISGVLRSRSPY